MYLGVLIEFESNPWSSAHASTTRLFSQTAGSPDIRSSGADSQTANGVVHHISPVSLSLIVRIECIDAVETDSLPYEARAIPTSTSSFVSPQRSSAHPGCCCFCIHGSPTFLSNTCHERKEPRVMAKAKRQLTSTNISAAILAGCL